MAQNKILPWAQTPDANALSDADYSSAMATNGAYANGVKSGQASSHQANKTWRQATAPGSGLGQFLVDNLSVDVTDADTPSTFSTRIANAVLKLSQISPFNQSWATATGGYRKYAIVSDSSGNYWVSTSDQNVTVPGVSGSSWRSLFDGYATNKALQSEASSRADADSNLQDQVNNRVVKTGDKMTGSLTIEGDTGGFTTQYNPGSPASGSFINYPGFTSRAEGRGGQVVYGFQEQVGSTFRAIIASQFGDGSWRYVKWGLHERINDSQFGDVAYTSDFASRLGANGYIKIPTTQGWKLVQQWVVFQGTTGPGGNSNGIYETQDIFVTWPLGMGNLLRIAGLSVEDIGGAGMNEKVWVMTKPTATGALFRLACNQSGVTMTGSAFIIGSVAS